MANLQHHRRHGTRPAAVLASLFVLFVLLIPTCALSAQDEDVKPDLNALRAKADAGSVTAQTQLADFYIASDDYTNAVMWYRKAAEQGDLTAQLSLASLLIAGRGTEKNPHEAAKWLRAAADRIDNNRPGSTPAAVGTVAIPPTNTTLNTTTSAALTAIAPAPPTNPKPPTNAIIITRSSTPSATTKPATTVTPTPAVVSTSSPPANATATAPTNPLVPARIQRAGVILPSEPTVQDTPPVVRAPQEK